LEDAAPSESHGQYIPGHPPILKTGEEIVAIKPSLVLPRATESDPMIVKVNLLGGRQYMAVIDEPHSFNRSKSTNEPVGWSGGSMAKNTSWLLLLMIFVRRGPPARISRMITSYGRELFVRKRSFDLRNATFRRHAEACSTRP
jgi:hypothetical protein